jgi:subtilisin family serine protease
MEPLNFKLKYGRSLLDLTESTTKFGIRPQRNQEHDAMRAVRNSLGDASWNEVGLVGGFLVVSVEDKDIEVGRALDTIRLNSSIEVGTHVFEQPDGRSYYVPTGEIFIEFRPNLSSRDKQSLLDKFKLSIKEARGRDSLILQVTRGSPNPIKVAAALQSDDRIVVAEPDLASKQLAKSLFIPTDLLLNDQWHLKNTGFHRGTDVGFVAGADARIIGAWSAGQTIGEASVVVAVVDDGFDLKHPDFSSPGKVVHPWDFTRRNSDCSPDRGDWHGTACAGVALASAGGGSVVGVAPGCTFMPIRWGPDLSDSQIESWFDYASGKGAWVVSCSWGALNPFFPLSTRAERAIEKCATEGRSGKGCVVVFAAGNSNRNVNNPADGTVDGFAIHPDVIAVAASTSRDERSDYSNFGAEISVCAPSSGAGGWGILTADVTGFEPGSGFTRGYSEGDYTYGFGGTSSACPLVAGVAALILSINPNLTSKEVRAILQKTARKIGRLDSYDGNGHSKDFGFGCVDAEAALRIAALGAQPAIAARQRPAQIAQLSMQVRKGKSKRRPEIAKYESVSFESQIKPLFRIRDISSMRTFGMFDLSKYDDVVAHASDIYARLSTGSMPCDGAWQSAQVELFQQWIDDGMKP